MQIRRQHRLEAQKSEIVKIFAQLSAIPWSSIWGLALAVGGIFLLIYFASIGFLPDLELKDLMGTIAAVALVGIFFVAIVGGSLMLPTVYLNVESNSAKFTAFFQAGLGLLLPFFIILNASFESRYRNECWWAIGITTIVLLFLISYRSVKRFSLNDLFLTSISVGLWAFWVLAIPMLLCLSILQQSNQEDWLVICMLFLFPAMFALFSIAVASSPAHRRGLALLFCVIFAIVFLSHLSRRPALVPQAAITMLGLSVDREHVTIILTENGCNSVNLALKNDGKPCALDATAKLGALPDARIISRIGSQIVTHWRPLKLPVTARTDAQLFAALKDGKNEIWQRIVLRKADAISWAYDYNKPPKEH
ncbi:MAG: hypothetical protein QM533_05790 [Cytophagales bacterium]|nr:hypothetical protein [Cytophagales bacterium]